MAEDRVGELEAQVAALVRERDGARAMFEIMSGKYTEWFERAATIEALLRQQPGVAVKPLEWREYVDGACIDLRTHTIVGGYSAWTLNGYNWNLDFNGDRLQSGLSSKGVAKAAAQADYEQRIRSALEPQLLQNPPQLPDGWVMVPKEPTEAMMIAGCDEDDPLGGLVDWKGESVTTREVVARVYRAMLAVLPSQNVEG